MVELNRVLAAAERDGISRRVMMGWLGALAAVPLLGREAKAEVRGARVGGRGFASDPFSLGVASGDPDSSSVVLWTRLAVDVDLPDGGMGRESVPVAWELAADEGMKKVVKRGTAMATAALGHSVHVEAQGLEPGRPYWYRFTAGDGLGAAQSEIGRTRTMPGDAEMPGELRFAFASCQHWEAGFYTPYEQMARDELDMVFFLGDYIYEGPRRVPPAAATRPTDGRNDPLAPQAAAQAATQAATRLTARQRAANRRAAASEVGRIHSVTEGGGVLNTLTDYRLRYAQYKSDSLLQAAHASCPWWVTWDDHEVVNNYANDRDGPGRVRGAEFLRRRAAAYQAYYEMMPLRARSMPRGADLMLYRGGKFGRLAEFSVLDTRQYRTDQPNGDRASPLNAEALAASQTLMGAEQKAWLKGRLAASQGTWNIVAQQVMMGMLKRHPAEKPEEDVYSMDAWTGYAAERVETMRYLAERKIANPVVLTGDVHANYVNELRVDDRETDKPVVAAEFVGTSISSGGDGSDVPAGVEKLMSDNAGLKYHNRERGYVRCRVTPGQWETECVTVPEVTKPGATARVRAKFVVEAGKAGIQRG